MSTAAVFLDRDGTLIEDPGYLDDPAQVRLLDGVAEALRVIEAAGYLRVVITNQSGIGRGRYSAAQFNQVQEEMERQLRTAGATINATYHCPHAPDAGCTCRKPGTALYREAIAALDIDTPASWCIGDRPRDVLPAGELGMHAVLLGEDDVPPDLVAVMHAHDLLEGCRHLPRYLGAP